MRQEIEIRLATLEDAKDINAIYTPYILNTAVTFEYEPVSEEQFQERIRKISSRCPYLVCCIDSKIVGYAYLAPFQERAAFGWDVEITVYIHEEYHRRNIATALYEAMFELAYRLGYYNIYALIADPNERSVKLHEKMGFERVGLYPKTGYKFGQWWGLNILCKQLRDFAEVPCPTKSIRELDKKEISDILEQVSSLVKKV